MDIFHIFGVYPRIIIMDNVVFRNYDRFGITNLLKNIGSHRLSTECQNRHLPIPKRVSLFYLENSVHGTSLKYTYQNGAHVVMKIDAYEMPETGWVRVILQ